MPPSLGRGQSDRENSPSRNFVPRLLRFLVGAPTPKQPERTSWSKYLVDLAGWAAVAAVVTIMVFLVYRGLELVGPLK